jgi:hypothetical protein
MPQITVTTSNTFVDAQTAGSRPGQARRGKSRRSADEHLKQRIQQVRQQVYRTACSATWAEDCLYRGAQYSPDFRCQCTLCRERFPERLYPREARQSDYSADCQLEAENDPELAEDLDRLRNDRERMGSVFIVRGSDERGRVATRQSRAD